MIFFSFQFDMLVKLQEAAGLPSPTENSENGSESESATDPQPDPQPNQSATDQSHLINSNSQRQ